MAAGVEIANAWVSIKPSALGLKKGIEGELAGLDKVAQSEGDKAGESFGDRFKKSTGKSLGDVSKTALVASAAIGGGLLLAARSAGDLEAAISANEQVLGDVSKGVQTWAKDSVKNFGLSERAAIDAATSFGAIGKVAGMNGAPLGKFSQDLVGLAADMAAFANVPVAQTLQDLQGGFAGQTEVLRKYNVYLDDAGLKSAYFKATGEKVTGVLTAQQRIVATNAEIWRQTADQQGQAAREAGGFARAQDNFKATLENTAASIGGAVLPVVTKLMQGLTDGIGVVGGLNDATGGLLGTFAGFAAAGLGAVGVVAGIGSKIGGAIDGFKNLSGGMQKAAVGAGLVTVALIAGMAIWSAMGAKQREVEARTKEVASALQTATKEVWDHAEAAAGAAGQVDGLATAEAALSKALADTGADGKRLTQALGTLHLQTKDTVDVLSSMQRDPVKALESLARSAGVSEEQMGALARAVNSTDSNAGGLQVALIGQLKAMGMSQHAANALSSELLPVAKAMEEVQDQAEKTDFSAIARESLTTAAASSEASEALVKQAEANTGLSRSGADAAKVWAEFNVLLGKAPKSVRDAVNGTKDLAKATGDLNTVQASSIDLTSKAQKALDDAASAASAYKGALDRLIGGQVGLQATQDQLIAGAQQITDVTSKLTDEQKANGAALDRNTEAGQANRAMLRDQATGTLSLASSMLETGHSIGEVTDALNFNRLGLINQAEQFGLTRAQAEEYVDQLGLTPTSIETAVKLAGDAQAKSQVDAMLSKLDTLPESVATDIKALIAAGDYAKAKRMLDNLAMPKTVYYNVRTGQNTKSAWGNYFSRPGFTSIAEDGDPEAVVTLGKPANLRRQLQDPRIGGPIIEALGGAVTVQGGGGGVPLVGTLVTGASEQDVRSALDRVAWLAAAR